MSAPANSAHVPLLFHLGKAKTSVSKMLSAAAANVVACCILGATVLVLVGWGVVAMRRLPLSPAQTVLYGINVLLTRLLWRAEISGQVAIADDRGAVIVCNHRSPIDPSFIQFSVRRAVYWMVAKEYCRKPIVGWLLRICEVMPTSRNGADAAATKTAIRRASEGHLVGILLEGRINTTDELLLPGRPGAALIALKARVPVVPCYVEGSPFDGTYWGCFLMPAKVRLKIGRPIDLSAYYGRENEREVLEELTRRFLTEIARLAGRADFQPRVAGRFGKRRLAALA